MTNLARDVCEQPSERGDVIAEQQRNGRPHQAGRKLNQIAVPELGLHRENTAGGGGLLFFFTAFDCIGLQCKTPREAGINDDTAKDPRTLLMNSALVGSCTNPRGNAGDPVALRAARPMHSTTSPSNASCTAPPTAPHAVQTRSRKEACAKKVFQARQAQIPEAGRRQRQLQHSADAIRPGPLEHPDCSPATRPRVQRSVSLQPRASETSCRVNTAHR